MSYMDIMGKNIKMYFSRYANNSNDENKGLGKGEERWVWDM